MARRPVLPLPGRRHTFPERGLRLCRPHSSHLAGKVGRRHTFPERGLRLVTYSSQRRRPQRPKAHVPREGFETPIGCPSAALSTGPKAHVPREGFETNLITTPSALEFFGRRHTFPERGLRLVTYSSQRRRPQRPKAHVPREGFETRTYPKLKSDCLCGRRHTFPERGLRPRRH